MVEKQKKLYTLFGFFLLAVLIELLFFRNVLFTDNLIGDNGDARYICLILEHWFNFFKGNEAFSDFISFYPAKNTISYSDMLLGFAVPFSFFRLLGLNMFISAKYTFVIFHCIGTISMIWLLNKKFNFHFISTAIGTICFSYAISLSNKVVHNQFFAICLVPLILVFLFGYLENINSVKNKRIFNGISMIIVYVIIFYTSYYTAYFLSIMFLIMLITFITVLLFKNVKFVKNTIKYIIKNIFEFILYIFNGIILMIPFLCVYLPTLKTSGGYSWADKVGFIPSWYDILNISSRSLLYGGIFAQEPFASSSMELRVGLPIFELILFIISTVFIYNNYIKNKLNDISDTNFLKKENAVTNLLIFSGAITVIVIYLLVAKFNGFTLWIYVNKFFPGASAIRAVARIWVMFIVPVSITIAFFINSKISPKILNNYDLKPLNDKQAKKSYIKSNVSTSIYILFMCFALILVFENSFKDGAYSYWNETDATAFVNTFDVVPPKDCKVFFLVDSSNNLHESATLVQIEAWQIAVKYNIKTIHGYSGNCPKGWGEIWNIKSPEYLNAVDNWINMYELKNVYYYDISQKVWGIYKAGNHNGIDFNKKNI